MYENRSEINKKQHQELELVEERIVVVSKVTDGNINNKINQDRRRKVLVVVDKGQ